MINIVKIYKALNPGLIPSLCQPPPDPKFALYSNLFAIVKALMNLQPKKYSPVNLNLYHLKTF